MRRYKKSFSVVLASADSSMTKRRFLRLFLMALTLIIVLSTSQAYVLYKNSSMPFIPYKWSVVHDKEAWRTITFIPTNGVVIYDRWAQIATGFVVFLFSGLGTDAVKFYRRFLLKLGLGKIFPRLAADHSTRRRSHATDSQASSVGSRARLLVTRAFGRTPTNSTYVPFQTTLNVANTNQTQQ